MLGNESKEQTMLCRMCPIVRRQCDANTTPARACFAYLFAQITRRLHWFDHQGLHLVSVFLFLPLFVFSFSIHLIIFTLRTSKDAGEWRQSAAKVGVFWEREKKWEIARSCDQLLFMTQDRGLSLFRDRAASWQCSSWHAIQILEGENVFFLDITTISKITSFLSLNFRPNLIHAKVLSGSVKSIWSKVK